MAEMMTFPDTWEEFEKSYGFTDNEEVYTNGARLIPSFRVKQWLDHLPSVQPEIIRCKYCKHWHNAPSSDGYNSCEKDALIRHESFFCADAKLRGDLE